jgi:hypothetical protein
MLPSLRAREQSLKRLFLGQVAYVVKDVGSGCIGGCGRSELGRSS